MAYELIATSVTSGLTIRLGEIFPDVSRYRETVAAQNLKYPHFFINQLTISTETERRNHVWVNYFATIRYHHVQDPVTNYQGLQEVMDRVSIEMLSELSSITWDGMPVEITNARTEKIDGVLHWFGNIRVMASKYEPIAPLQQTLYATIRTKEE